MEGQTYIEKVSGKVGQEILICGWLFNRRSSGRIQFLLIRDGTGIIQGVLVEGEVPQEFFTLAERLTQESSIKVCGVVREDPRAPGGYELTISSLQLVHLAQDYPIAKKEHGVGFLMDHRHLWIRSSRQIPVLRIRHEVLQAIRDFFHQRGFIATESPILTPAAVEGTTTLFEVDYFDDKAYLTQSGQLYLEATAMALGRVYWIGPTFRAERSKTRKHLTEFWMAEAEMAYYEHQDNLRLQEELVCYVVERALDCRRLELEQLERDIGRLKQAVEEPFARISYAESLEILRKAGREVAWGQDFGAPEEEILGDHFKRPVFVEAFPAEMKAFYMEPMPDNPDLVQASDLIAPEGYGELIGGSQRVTDLAVLESKLDQFKLPRGPYEWYLDLRRYGSVPHSGFGLGIERTVAWICGIQHVREAIPFARQLYRLTP